MQTQPPFDPPYVSKYSAEEGVQYIETLADGTTRVLSASEYAVRFPALPIATPGGNGEVPGRGAANARTAAPSKSGSASSATGKAAVFLNVPFAEKDTAKAMGARWDAANKKWYVPHGVDVNLFSRWLPDGLK